MLLSAALTALEQVGDAASWSMLDPQYTRGPGMPPFLAPQLLRLMAKCAPESALTCFFEDPYTPTGTSLGAWLDGAEVFHDRHAFRAIPSAHFDRLCSLLRARTSAVPRFRLAKWLGRLELQAGVVQVLSACLDSDDESFARGPRSGFIG